MKTLTNILVGIEIDNEGLLASGTEAALKRALWLAGQKEASLTFMHVIDMPEPVSAVMSVQPQSPVSHRIHQAKDLLQELVAKAEKAGLRATSRVEFGTHWRELICAVVKQQHDLVIIGTRGRGLVSRTLFGSTGNKLLRYCPCPVWTVKPQDHDNYEAVLVAHDLTEVGQKALQVAAEVARLQKASLHVLHVLELPEDKKFLGTITGKELEQRHAEARDELLQQCKSLGIDSSVTIKTAEGSAHAGILDYLKKHPIDLLCMGTVARSGIAGLLTGNTAENVMPWVACSLIAVKPEDFVTPVDTNQPHQYHLRSSGRDA